MLKMKQIILLGWLRKMISVVKIRRSLFLETSRTTNLLQNRVTDGITVVIPFPWGILPHEKQEKQNNQKTQITKTQIAKTQIAVDTVLIQREECPTSSSR
ncbi:MAG: hypothetical protein IKI01_06260 [Lachnospiraceae bacterium]|nr:hypothetical protein [Lachnospiraceae bacterium]